MNCVLQGLQWLGESVHPLQSTPIQWLPPCAVADEGKMCTYVDQLLCPRMEDGTARARRGARVRRAPDAQPAAIR
jgi:hypothetical protein